MQFTKGLTQGPVCVCVCVCARARARFGKAGKDIKPSHIKSSGRYNYGGCLSFYSL